jgi:hypothetical protein
VAIFVPKERSTMRLLTHDPRVVRLWAESRHAKPAMDDEGALLLALPDHEYTVESVIGWPQFERLFAHRGLAFVYEDRPGSNFWLIAADEDAWPFVEEAIPAHVP